MRFLLKLLFAPVMAVLAVVSWFLVFVVGLSSGILCIPAAILGFFGLFIIFVDSVSYGAGLLVIAVLISPYGLPMLAGWLVAKLHVLRYMLRDWIYGYGCFQKRRIKQKRGAYRPALFVLFDLVILAVVGLAGGAGEAQVRPCDAAACRPDGRAADHASCAVFLGGKGFPQCRDQLPAVGVLVVFYYAVRKFFNGNIGEHIIPPV